MRGTSLFTATLRTRKEFLPCQGLSWPGGRTIGALRAERQMLTSANGTSCSARHELSSRAFLFIVSAECALPTNASLFANFARILAYAPPPHESLRTCFVCATHASARSIGFCVIWVCISSSSSSKNRRHRRTDRQTDKIRCYSLLISEGRGNLPYFTGVYIYGGK